LPDDDSFGIETCTNAECRSLNRVVSDRCSVLFHFYASELGILFGSYDIRTGFLHTKLFAA